ncbi:hypothetical protein LTR95_002577 [Oleoguttula sp. CCFEE 5521]
MGDTPREHKAASSPTKAPSSLTRPPVDSAPLTPSTLPASSELPSFPAIRMSMSAQSRRGQEFYPPPPPLPYGTDIAREREWVHTLPPGAVVGMGIEQREAVIDNFAQEIRRDVWYGYPNMKSTMEVPAVSGGVTGFGRGVLPVEYGYGAQGQRERGGSVGWFAGGQDGSGIAGLGAFNGVGGHAGETEYLARRVVAWGMGSRVPDESGIEGGVGVNGGDGMEIEAEVEVEEYVMGRPGSPGRGIEKMEAG